MIADGVTPRDIVGRDSLRNAVIVAMAVGGSTNVVLHAPEIARAAGFADFWTRRDDAGGVQPPLAACRAGADRRPALSAAIPWSISTRVGGVQVIVKELMDAGLLNGDVPTCTGETLAEQVARLDTPAAGRDGCIYRAPAPTSRPAACACWAAISRPITAPS